VPSLDTPAGEQRLCRGLRHPRVAAVEYERPFMAYSISDRDSNHPRVVLGRCGSRRLTVVRHGVAQWLLSKTYLTWTTPAGPALHVRSLASGRTRVIKMPPGCRLPFGGGRFVICASDFDKARAFLIDLQSGH